MLELSIGCSDCPIASVPVARIGLSDLKAEVWCPGKYNCDEQLTFWFYQHTASMTGEKCGRRKSSQGVKQREGRENQQLDPFQRWPRGLR